MKTNGLEFVRGLFPPFGHPGFKRLVDWSAGELAGRRLTATSRHIRSCPRCRAEADRITNVIERSSAALDREASPPAASQAVGRLPELLRDPALIRAAQDRHRQEQALRLVAGLKPWLGHRPMSLLERTGAGGFLPEVRRTAALFLGRRAAGALIGPAGLEADSAEGRG